MNSHVVVDDFSCALRARSDWRALKEALAEATRRMGFQFFAAIHHVDFCERPNAGLRLHNYPADLVARFDVERRGPSDPIHRASHRTANGFRWRDVANLIDLTRHDEEILRDARSRGIGDGFTKPAHIPGEARGSVSFAVETGRAFPEDMIYCAQIVGDLAFDAARRTARRSRPTERLQVTDRQLECILWVGRGKTDVQIADILGVARSTVIEHLRNARSTWELSTRGVLPLRALVEGVLCLSDFFPDASPFVGML